VKWISVKEQLPKPHRSKTKRCPAAIAYYADGVLDDCLIQATISNTEYLRLHPHLFTHWMPLPDPPTE
jgi:hypothetical protein